jgi:uncharacterized membrane protein YkoI
MTRMPDSFRFLAVATAFVTISPASAFEMPETKVSMESCLQAALAAKPGEVRHLKLEVEDGRPFYEFTIRTAARQTWEIECDATTSEIAELSRTADRNDAEFKAAARLIEREARQAALAKYPGKVSESELQIDGSGRALYEITIEDSSGREMEVAVDAATGAIVHAEDESAERTIYEVGED